VCAIATTGVQYFGSRERRAYRFIVPCENHASAAAARRAGAAPPQSRRSFWKQAGISDRQFQSGGCTRSITGRTGDLAGM